MSTEPNESNSSLDSAQNRTFAVRVALAVAAVAIGIWVLSFLVLPVIDVRGAGIDSWTAICRAVGITPRAPSPVSPPTSPASTMAWNTATRDGLAHADPIKGEAIAVETCAGCHNANGLSVDPETTPTTTGLPRRAIFKQLMDMKSGHRVNDAMAPLLEGLDEQSLADLAAYYSGLPVRNYDIHALKPATEAATQLATKGDVARAIPACNACHGSYAGGPLETPTLAGQYPGYIAAQLKSYASGVRKNDLYGRMRRIAGKLTDQEIAELADYYNAPR